MLSVLWPEWSIWGCEPCVLFRKLPAAFLSSKRFRIPCRPCRKRWGGYIETFTFATDACVVCNEEGRLLDLPYNCDLLGVSFCGPILIIGINGDEFCDIPSDMQKLFRCLDKVER